MNLRGRRSCRITPTDTKVAVSSGTQGNGIEIPVHIIRKNLNATCKIQMLNGTGTGFLILLHDIHCVLTCNHVLPTLASASSTSATFGDDESTTTTIHFNPRRLFITDMELDFTVVALETVREFYCFVACFDYQSYLSNIYFMDSFFFFCFFFCFLFILFFS